MPKEPVDCEWTLGTLFAYLEAQIARLREYHDQSVEAQAQAVRVAMRASEKAIDKAEQSTNRRLDQIAAAGYLSRDEYLVQHAALAERVDLLQARIDRSEGRGAGFNAIWLVIVAAIASIGTVITVVILITGR